MNRMPTIALAMSLALLVPVACQEAGQPLGTENESPTADARGGGTFVDEDGDGRVAVALDASRSADSDGNIVSYVWTEEGTSIATGVSPEVMLDVGEHHIVLSVTDSEGATGEDAVLVFVVPKPVPNGLPTVTILSPTQDQGFLEGDRIQLSGRAEDPEDGPLSGRSLVWYFDSVRIGISDTAVTWTLPGTQPGTHVVMLAATDADGGRSWTQVGIRVLKVVSFAEEVLPFFTSYCTECHGELVARAGIRLDSYEAIVTGGNANGPLIVPGDPSQGILIPQVLSDHEPVGWGGNEYSHYMGTVVLPAWIETGALPEWIEGGAPGN